MACTIPYMIAWGSGQNALLGYLSMPFIWLFGLNTFGIRLLPALLGVFSILLVYKVAKNMAGVIVGLLSAFILAISPWHITLSRWALESNLLPTILLLAFFFLLRAQKKQKGLWMPALFFGLALYAYSPAYAFVPVFGVVYFAYACYFRFFSLKQWLGAFALFLLVTWPIAVFLLINYLRLPSLDLYFFSIPQLSGSPRYTQMSPFFSADFWKTTWDNLSRVIEILFLKGNDGEMQNTVHNVGAIYLLSVPFWGIGFFKMTYELIRKKGRSLLFPVFLWFIVAFVVACFSVPAMHRMNMVFFPMIIITAYGFSCLWALSRPVSLGFIALYLFFFLRFLTIYFTDYARDVGAFFFESYTEAVSFAYKNAASSDTLYLSDDLNQPYIHVLFVMNYDPREYIRTVKIRDESAPFQIIESFGRFVFGVRTKEALDARVLVVKNNELHRFDLDRYWITPLNTIRFYLIEMIT